jgi:hypothetical protein
MLDDRRDRRSALWLGFEVGALRILCESAIYNVAEFDGQDYHVEC